MSLLPPFFGELMAYDGKATIAFDCPGHQGGQFYRKSPTGQLFFKHFGEAIFRNDLCNADVELGDLLIHEGAADEAQTHAAEVFGADRTYFVLNGTSTSNKIVTGALLKRGDLVLFDRNNHKSLHQGALVQAGAIPVFLPTARNAFGMIGPVDWDAWDEASLRERSAPTRWSRTSRAPTRRGPSAWPASSCAPTTARSTTCARCWRRSATCATTCCGTRPGSATTPSTRCSTTTARCGWRTWAPRWPGLFSTQSVHKQGAGFSQASQIHKRDEHLRGPEALRRPQALQRVVPAARLDLAVLPAVRVARRQRQDARGQGRRDAVGPLHRARHRDAQEAARVRPALRAQPAAAPQEQWFFDPFVPDRVTVQPLALRRRRHRRALGEPADRADQARAAVLELPARRALARLRRHGRRLRDGRPEQADAADAGHRPRHRRLPRLRRAGHGGRELPARAAHRAREVRPEQHPVPDDAGRGRKQAQHA